MSTPRSSSEGGECTDTVTVGYAGSPDACRYGRAVEMPAELRSELDAMFRSGGLGGMLGFRLVDWAPGRALVELQPTAAIANITGSVHGGVLYTVADSAFEVACNSYGRVCVALDVSVHHASAAPLGQPVVAEAVEVSRSPRVASYRITATGADGEIRALARHLACRTLSRCRHRGHPAASPLPGPTVSPTLAARGVSSTGRAADF